jgi:hypothetical protein
MKIAKRKASVIFLVVSLAALLSMAVVQGAVDWTQPYNNLASGYAVTTENFPDPVQLGEPVIAWAGTTNAGVDEVKFRWIPPEGSGLEAFIIIGTQEASVEVPNVGTVYQWTSTYTPMEPAELGDWGIQALFYEDGAGQGIGPVPEQPSPVRIIARSFHVVPEAALGTVALLIAMLGAFGIFRLRSKSRSKI